MALSAEQLKYVHGLKQLKFNSKTIGYINEEGVDWGGDEPTTVKVFAAQMPTTAVCELIDNPGSDVLSFDLIQLDAQSLADVMGGKVKGTSWEAPAIKAPIVGAFEILTHSGHKIAGGKASLVAYPRGKLKGKELFVVHCMLTILSDGSSPYTIGDATA